MNNLIGQSLGRYHITEKLGEGGMATVYKAFDTQLERDVAIKIIRRDAFSKEVVDRILQRFEREAKALSKMTHPNIVPIIDFGDEGGAPYLVMPLISGGTLKDRLISKIYTASDAARLLVPIARALDYTHANGILHRDVKPSNILITDNGDPLLSDFGVAKIVEDAEGSTLTGTGVGLGTPEYMAPEQWVGKATPASDQYSLGVILYEMLTKHKPFSADTPAAVVLKQATEALPRPREFTPNLPAEVERILFKSLAKKPEDRYSSLSEMAQALTQIERSDSRVMNSNLQKTPATSDTFATIDQMENKIMPQNPPPLMPPPLFINQDPIPRSKIPLFLGFGVGLVGLIFLIITISGGFSPKKYMQTTEAPTAIDVPIAAATEAPTATDAPIAAPTEAPAATEAPFGIGSTQISPIDGMTMVYVPAGEFLMGSLDGVGENDEHPQHAVTLDAYWIDQTEVTNALITQCVSEGGCPNPPDYSSYTGDSYFGNLQYDDYPVIYVNWEQASAYCQWAGRELPTEAQWEKAARGTNGQTYPWGNDPPAGNLVNFADSNTIFDFSDKTINDGYADTAPVGSYPDGASPYGALDMAGNVWEWVADSYGTYPSENVSNLLGSPTGETRVLRGGSWFSSTLNIRSARRFGVSPTIVDYSIGFRCALDASVNP